MGDYMSGLPHDILCTIFSSLTVRDAFRVKSLALSWKDLPDTRSLLQFDANTIVREQFAYINIQEQYDLMSKFVEGVNQFFKIWRAQKASALKIKYGLGGLQTTAIDSWIAIAIAKEIEELDLDFSFETHETHDSCGMYQFPFHLLDIDKGNHLRHLRLNSCWFRLTRFGDVSTSWGLLSKLCTLELIHTPLNMSDYECIISSCQNLELLRLDMIFQDFESLDLHHPSLKKLQISGFCQQIELSCPRLETFEFIGRCHSYFSFSKVPLLKETSLNLFFRDSGCSNEFKDLAKNAPLLQSLSLSVTTEVVPIPPTMTMSCLKRLDLLLRKVSQDFDLLTITHMLYASPVLEELKLTMDRRGIKRQHKWRHYLNRPHFHLKEVKFEGLPKNESLSRRLIEYLLRNSVSLKQMVFITNGEHNYLTEYMDQLQFNPTVEFIVQRAK